MINIFRALFRHPRRFYRNLRQYSEESRWAHVAQTKLRLHDTIKEIQYCELVGQSETNLRNITFRPGGSTIPDYVLLVELCKQAIDCHYFEIGTLFGESISNVAPVCSTCVSLSLPEEQYVSSDVSKEQARRVTRMFSNNVRTITHMHGDSRIFDFDSIQERFDVIFIDGGHDYECAKSDTRNAIRLLRNQSSVIVFHDAKNAYNELEPEVMCGIYQGLPEESRKYLYTVENTLCAIFQRRDYPTIERVNLKSSFYAAPKIVFNLKSQLIRL